MFQYMVSDVEQRMPVEADDLVTEHKRIFALALEQFKVKARVDEIGEFYADLNVSHGQNESLKKT